VIAWAAPRRENTKSRRSKRSANPVETDMSVDLPGLVAILPVAAGAAGRLAA
jgi:hypothetical protein